MIENSAENRSLKSDAKKAKNSNEESVTEELKNLQDLLVLSGQERDEFEAKCHQMGKEKEQINNGWSEHLKKMNDKVATAKNNK